MESGLLMVKRCRVRELPRVAFHYGSATASDGRWRAERLDDFTVFVWHYSTLMVAFHFESVDRGLVYARAINAGWGSRSDRVGIGDMLRDVRAHNAGSYRELYREVVG